MHQGTGLYLSCSPMGVKFVAQYLTHREHSKNIYVINDYRRAVESFDSLMVLEMKSSF